VERGVFASEEHEALYEKYMAHKATSRDKRLASYMSPTPSKKKRKKVTRTYIDTTRCKKSIAKARVSIG
jgi:hypothetical protein